MRSSTIASPLLWATVHGGGPTFHPFVYRAFAAGGVRAYQQGRSSAGRASSVHTADRFHWGDAGVGAAAGAEQPSPKWAPNSLARDT